MAVYVDERRFISFWRTLADNRRRDEQYKKETGYPPFIHKPCLTGNRYAHHGERRNSSGIWRTITEFLIQSRSDYDRFSNFTTFSINIHCTNTKDKVKLFLNLTDVTETDIVFLMRLDKLSFSVFNTINTHQLMKAGDAIMVGVSGGLIP